MPSAHRRRETPPALAYLGLTLAMFVWASSFVALKLAFRGFAPDLVIFGRMAIASLCFLPLLRRYRAVRLERGDWLPILGMALCEPCLYFLFEARALANTSASQAGVITSLLPVMVAVGAAWLLGEQVGGAARAGCGLAVLGAVWLSLAAAPQAEAPNPALGNLYEFLAMVCATGYTLLLKRLSSRIPPFLLTGIQAAVGTLFFLPLALRSGPWLEMAGGATAAAAVIYLGTAVTLGAYGLYNYGVSKMPASQAGAFVNMIPVFGILLGGVILGETLSPPQWVASALILGGVLLTQATGHRATPAGATP